MVEPLIQISLPVQPHAEAISVAQLWAWLAEIPDPEIPVVSIVELGIVRDVAWDANDPELARVTVTPTYSGCPATDVISHQIRQELRRHGVPRVQLDVRLSPAWTTDWLTAAAKHSLLAYGIVPPGERAPSPGDPLTASLAAFAMQRQGAGAAPLPCPRCHSANTEMVSRFGSTPCKALHRCLSCREPFEHFKCH